MRLSRSPVIALLLLSIPACSGTIPLNEMPTPDQIVRDIHGTTDTDTALSRATAFEVLMDGVMLLGRPDGRQSTPLPVAYAAKAREYMMATQQTLADAHLTRSDMYEWRNTRKGEEFQTTVVRKYLSQGAREAVRAAGGAILTVPRAYSPAPDEVAKAMPPEARTAVQAIAGISGALFILGILSGFRRVGLTKANPSKLVAELRRYNIHTVTGMVRSPSKALETLTRVSGTGYNVTSSSQTYVHDQFFIVHPDGETSIQLVDVNLALREGHLFSAVWAIRRGRKSGWYILFRNHTTNERTYIDANLRWMLRPRIWPMTMFLLSLWAFTLIDRPAAGASDQIFRQSLDLAQKLTVGGIIAWMVMCAVVIRWRVWRFKRQDAKHLTEALDARAKETSATMGGWATPA